MSTSANTPLRRSLLVAFTLPTLILGIMHGPEGQIPSIYAKHAGLSLTALATAMLLTKLFDAFTYPLIGALSDRTYARTGSRRSWIIAGTLISVVGVWFLQRPPPDVGIVYFSVWTAVVYVGWKVIEIPLQAWSYGLSADYAQRGRVQAWRAMSQVTGALLFFLIPFLAMKLGYSDSSELDFRNLGFAAAICVVALPLATLAAILHVPAASAAPAPTEQRYGFRETLAAVRRNPPLLRLLAAFLPFGLLTGFAGGIAYLYMDTYLGLSAQYPAIMLSAMLGTIVGIPFWVAMSARYERHRVWAVGLIAGGLICTVFAAISPGPWALPICFVLYPALAMTLISTVIVYAMSADIVDYGRLHTGKDHGGLYGAMLLFLQKSLLGVSAAGGVALIGAFGFDATAKVQSTSGILGMKLAMGIIPTVGFLAAAAIIWNYPLSRARTTEIQEALARRDHVGG